MIYSQAALPLKLTVSYTGGDVWQGPPISHGASALQMSCTAAPHSLRAHQGIGIVLWSARSLSESGEERMCCRVFKSQHVSAPYGYSGSVNPLYTAALWKGSCSCGSVFGPQLNTSCSVGKLLCLQTADIFTTGCHETSAFGLLPVSLIDHDRDFSLVKPASTCSFA